MVTVKRLMVVLVGGAAVLIPLIKCIGFQIVGEQSIIML